MRLRAWLGVSSSLSSKVLGGAFLGMAFAGASAGAAAQLADFEPEAAAASSFPLTIRSIMRGPELVGESPVGLSWTDDSRSLYFRWRPGGGDWHETRRLYRVGRDGGDPELIPEEAEDSLSVLFGSGALSPDRRWRASAVRGDLYLVDRRSLSVRRLTDTDQQVMSPEFSADGQSVYYRIGPNLFSRDVGSGAVRQMTFLQPGPEPEEDDDPEGHEAFLDAQQIELFEHLRVDSLRDERQGAAEERRKAGEPKPLYLNTGEEVAALSSSPGGEWVLALLSTPAKDAISTMVPDWVTSSGYTEELNVRSKVGDDQSARRLVRIDVSTGEALDLQLTGEEVPETPKDDEDEASDQDRDPENDKPKLATPAVVGWNDAGTHALLTAVDFDYKGWRLYAMEGSTGDLTLLDTVEDEAWVGGPCFMRCLGWNPRLGPGLLRERGHGVRPDGTMVPARIYHPTDVGAEANGAGVIFVHGAGYLHNDPLATGAIGARASTGGWVERT